MAYQRPVGYDLVDFWAQKGRGDEKLGLPDVRVHLNSVARGGPRSPPPYPPPRGHWYLHILSPLKERDFGCETSERIEVIMFEQGEHREQDPKSSQESGGGVSLVPFHLAT